MQTGPKSRLLRWIGLAALLAWGRMAPCILRAQPIAPAPAGPPAHGQALPVLGPRGDYVTSAACRECHVDEHASWKRSYHRTMTQTMETNAVLGRFDGTTIEAEGFPYRVFQQDGEYLAEMPDPDILMYIVQGGLKRPLETLPRVTRPVVLATGSHHYQTYWVASQRHPTLLHTLPLVFLKEEQRWIPREAAFIHGPDDKERFLSHWNNQCIRCHSTGGNPGLDVGTGGMTTRVAELGIACEACHGPGRAHVDKQRTLPRSLLGTRKAEPDPTIIQPSRLEPKASAEICGQCHGEFVVREPFALAFATNGPLYRPGDNLHRTRYYIQHPRPGSSLQRQADLERNPRYFRERWWPDGTILAGGREYTALRASACFTRGSLSCLTCHSMHQGDPDDQLKPAGASSRVCLSCHQEPRFSRDLHLHTRHRAESPGSECMNCHMPHTSYALLKGIRSHQIDSPRLDSPAKLQTPNACNLCHLDKTLAWTADQLRAWNPRTSATLDADPSTLAASVLWTLKGNAAQRAVVAWHFGWAPARATSGTHWMTPILAPLLNDSYGVVRQIAWKTLRRTTGEPLPAYDFLDEPARRAAGVQAMNEAWDRAARLPGRSPGPNLAVLISTNGQRMESVLNRLLREQDAQSISVQE